MAGSHWRNTFGANSTNIQQTTGPATVLGKQHATHISGLVTRSFSHPLLFCIAATWKLQVSRTWARSLLRFFFELHRVRREYLNKQDGTALVEHAWICESLKQPFSIGLEFGVPAATSKQPYKTW